MKIIFLILIAGMMPFVLSGNDSAPSLDGPLLGFVAQSSPVELRAILGVPGAAVFSDPLTLPENTAKIRVAPGQDYALIESQSGEVAIMRLGRIARHPAPLPDLLRSPDSVVFSPAGKSVLLFSGTAGGQIVAGLPDQPHVVSAFAGDAIPGEASSFAVNDDGTAVLASTPAGGIYVLDTEGARQVYSSNGPAVLAFLAGANDAVFIDGDQHAIILLRDVGKSNATELLADGLDAVSGLLAIDGRRILVTTGNGAVSSLNVNTHEARELARNIGSAAPMMMRSQKTILLSAVAGEPAWLADFNEPDAKVFFIPAVLTQKDSDPEH